RNDSIKHVSFSENVMTIPFILLEYQPHIHKCHLQRWMNNCPVQKSHMARMPIPQPYNEKLDYISDYVCEMTVDQPKLPLFPEPKQVK
ncbi:hypothetical protein L9F63_003030, partial [Diploptera punctata]